MKKIYLIDGNSFIYRMFFGLPEFATKEGKVVNAIFGMAKFFVDSLVKQNPDYLIFLKDAKGKNFRHDLYEDYKATRDRMPDNLRTQMSDIEKMIKMMGVDIIEVDGYEADDVIGTLAYDLGKDKENDIYILSGDKDLYSLITDNVSVYDTMKRRIFNPEKAEEKFGVKPVMIIDYLAIVGDKADNIPGIDGFGPKKAVDLINIIGSVEKIYGFIDTNNLVNISEKEVKAILIEKYSEDDTKKIFGCFKGKTFEKLINSRDDAFLSKKLATIDLNIDLDKHMITDEVPGDGIIEKKFNLEDFKFKPEGFLNDDIKEYFKSLEFFSLIGEQEEIKVKTWYDLGLKVNIIDNKNSLDELFNKIRCIDKISLDTETTSLNIIEANLVGVSIYIDDENIFYINRLHEGGAINDSELKDFLIKILDLDILIIGHNLKYDLEIIELFLGNKKVKGTKDNNGSQMSLI